MQALTFSERKGRKKEELWEGGSEKGKSGGEGNERWRGEGDDRSEEQPCSLGRVFSKFSTPGTIKTNSSSSASRSIAPGRCFLGGERLLSRSCMCLGLKRAQRLKIQ